MSTPAVSGAAGGPAANPARDLMEALASVFRDTQAAQRRDPYVALSSKSGVSGDRFPAAGDKTAAAAKLEMMRATGTEDWAAMSVADIMAKESFFVHGLATGLRWAPVPDVQYYEGSEDKKSSFGQIWKQHPGLSLSDDSKAPGADATYGLNKKDGKWEVVRKPIAAATDEASRLAHVKDVLEMSSALRIVYSKSALTEKGEFVIKKVKLDVAELKGADGSSAYMIPLANCIPEFPFAECDLRQEGRKKDIESVSVYGQAYKAFEYPYANSKAADPDSKGPKQTFACVPDYRAFYRQWGDCKSNIIQLLCENGEDETAPHKIGRRYELPSGMHLDTACYNYAKKMIEWALEHKYHEAYVRVFGDNDNIDGQVKNLKASFDAVIVDLEDKVGKGTVVDAAKKHWIDVYEATLVPYLPGYSAMPRGKRFFPLSFGTVKPIPDHPLSAAKLNAEFIAARLASVNRLLSEPGRFPTVAETLAAAALPGRLIRALATRESAGRLFGLPLPRSVTLSEKKAMFEDKVKFKEVMDRMPIDQRIKRMLLYVSAMAQNIRMAVRAAQQLDAKGRHFDTYAEMVAQKKLGDAMPSVRETLERANKIYGAHLHQITVYVVEMYTNLNVAAKHDFDADELEKRGIKEYEWFQAEPDEIAALSMVMSISMWCMRTLAEKDRPVPKRIVGEIPDDQHLPLLLAGSNLDPNFMRSVKDKLNKGHDGRFLSPSILDGMCKQVGATLQLIDMETFSPIPDDAWEFKIDKSGERKLHIKPKADGAESEYQKKMKDGKLVADCSGAMMWWSDDTNSDGLVAMPAAVANVKLLKFLDQHRKFHVFAHKGGEIQHMPLAKIFEDMDAMMSNPSAAIQPAKPKAGDPRGHKVVDRQRDMFSIAAQQDAEYDSSDDF